MKRQNLLIMSCLLLVASGCSALHSDSFRCSRHKSRHDSCDSRCHHDCDDDDDDDECYPALYPGDPFAGRRFKSKCGCGHQHGIYQPTPCDACGGGCSSGVMSPVSSCGCDGGMGHGDHGFAGPWGTMMPGGGFPGEMHPGPGCGAPVMQAPNCGAPMLQTPDCAVPQSSYPAPDMVPYVPAPLQTLQPQKVQEFKAPAGPEMAPLREDIAPVPPAGS